MRVYVGGFTGDGLGGVKEWETFLAEHRRAPEPPGAVVQIVVHPDDMPALLRAVVGSRNAITGERFEVSPPASVPSDVGHYIDRVSGRLIPVVKSATVPRTHAPAAWFDLGTGHSHAGQQGGGAQAGS